MFFTIHFLFTSYKERVFCTSLTTVGKKPWFSKVFDDQSGHVLTRQRLTRQDEFGEAVAVTSITDFKVG